MEIKNNPNKTSSVLMVSVFNMRSTVFSELDIIFFLFPSFKVSVIKLLESYQDCLWKLWPPVSSV